MKSGIYEIVNGVNGKRYIGSAKSFRGRFRDHAYRLRLGTHRNCKLQRSWDKHGEGAFSFRPIVVCAPKDLLLYEQRCLDGLRPEYNIAKTADSPFTGRKHTAEWREKMSALQNGYKPSQETIAKLCAARAGRIISPETRAKTSASSKGRIASPETRAKIALSKLGNEFGKGRVVSDETRAKLSLVNMGKVLSAEHRAKVALGSMGNTNRRGKAASADTRAKLRAAWQRRKALES